MYEELHKILKIIIENYLNKTEIEIQVDFDNKIADEFSKGYYSFIKGLISYIKKKNEENIREKFIIHKLFTENDLDKYLNYYKQSPFDDKWSEGYKQAVKDAINFIKNRKKPSYS